MATATTVANMPAKMASIAGNCVEHAFGFDFKLYAQHTQALTRLAPLLPEAGTFLEHFHALFTRRTENKTIFRYGENPSSFRYACNSKIRMPYK